MNLSKDRIELTLPFKAEYVSVARLTVSGIASRMGFDIDTIEDIKVSVAEVCNRIISAGAETGGTFSTVFEISPENLVITFFSSQDGLKCIFREEEDELGISIINAFMDQVDFCPDDSYILSMTKSTEGVSWDGK